MGVACMRSQLETAEVLGVGGEPELGGPEPGLKSGSALPTGFRPSFVKWDKYAFFLLLR